MYRQFNTQFSKETIEQIRNTAADVPKATNLDCLLPWRAHLKCKSPFSHPCIQEISVILFNGDKKRK